ncbi:MAG TPA: hypothetical protein VH394_03010 [Thermoanaerobaculia bacterium]|jgi:hypothetical protein|nr:hypothetical protein [Thermoanaerobaculia bacterium]
MEFRELAERYDLAKILHSGRAGTVFRATDRRTGGPVVVKMISAGAAPLEEAANRFEAFAAALAVLKHPALPAVLDSGISPDGSAFLVLEPLEGRRLDLAGKLDLEAAVALVGLLGQVLDGLEAMAARGLAHGNLAPDNLFAVGAPADTQQLKLLGLGSAAFRGEVATARSDLFSFARTVCQLLGASVAPGDSPSVQLPFALTLELADDNALTRILERLLRREPAERPSFREVRAAFRQALGQSAPAPAAPAPPPPTIQAAPPPPAPVPVASPPVAAPPLPEPEPVLEGEVLQAITDEVLDALTAPPPPPPIAQVVEAAPPPPPPKRRTAVLVGALAAVLILAVLAGFWFLRRPAEEAAGPASSGPVVPPPPSPQTVLARLEEARQLLAMGDETRARETLRDLSFSGQSALPAEACARLADLEGLLDMMAVERLPTDLRRGLDNGDLGVLRTAVAAGAGLGPSLPADLKGDFETARRLVELHRLAEADAAEGKPVAVLEKMAEMSSLSPKLSDPLDLREKAAAAVEGEAETLAREAHYDEAIARLEPLQRTWSAREGLDARIAGYRTAKDDEARQRALLDQIPSWERRKKPHEPLEMLRGVKPTPHLAAQIAEATRRLEAQLAQLDQAAPVVELRPGFGLEYSRGNPVELGFRVRDDYEIKSVKMWAKAPGGKMKEMKLEEHLAGGYWSIVLPVSYHQNGTVELYVQATDRSGHEGWFGTRDKPMKVTRIGSNRV